MRSKFKWIFSLLMALSMQFAFAQERTITGTVSDGAGPVPGVNVTVKGTKVGVQTGFDGKYSIKAKTGDVLVYSFVGMTDTSRPVGTTSVVNVLMQDSAKVLAEVVVQGYRTVTKKSAVTAIATVTSATIENRPNANVMNTLQGQLAGVNITSGTGQPGAKSTVIIRGLGTLNGNSDPLYVIDGFPSNSDNFRSFNPNDIESVSVLKDAAAIAEYGSRGSNGVIVVKTKGGKFTDAKTTFKYSTNYGVSELQKPKYRRANAKQLLKIEKNRGLGYGSTLTDAQISAYDIDQNWVDVFFKQGTSINHNLGIENNGKNLNSYTSLGYFEQEGTLKTTKLQRFSLRSNINGKSADEKFRFQVNSAVNHSKSNEALSLGTGGVNQNYVLGAYQAAPYLSADRYVSSAQTYLDFSGVGNTLPGTADLSLTPYFLIDKLRTFATSTEETRVDIATEFSYKLTNDLTARSRVSGQLLSNRFFSATFPRSFNALLFNSAGSASTVNSTLNKLPYVEFDGSETIGQRREFFFNNLYQLAYNKVLGSHTLNVSLNAEYNYSQLNVNNFTQNGLDIALYEPNTGAGYIADNTTGANDFYVPTVAASNLRNDLIGYFASVDYDFKGKYGLLGSFRRDASSRFLKEDRYGNFYSVGARWNIDEEDFMSSLEFVDVLKLRGSYGTVGNQRIINGTVFAGIVPPAYVTTFAGVTGGASYAGQATLNPSFGAPGLKWETTKQWNIGLDFEFFKSRIRGSFDKYNKETVDQFFTDPQSPAFGASGFLRNSDATVTNDGYELGIAFDVIRNRDVTFTLRANGSYNKNTLSGITANDGRIPNGNLINRNGGPAFEYYTIPYAGVNPVNGNLLFVSKSGGTTENPIESDRVDTGKNYLPVYQGGFGFDFNYKGFFIASTFTFAAEVFRFDRDEEIYYQQSGYGDFNKSYDLLNAWTPTNTTSNIPSLTAGNEGQDDNSDRFLRDASYIRLRNAQIGYNVPQKFLDKTFMTGLSFTLQGENLVNFTKWQGFDPESDRAADSRQYPTPKIFTFGVDLRF